MPIRVEWGNPDKTIILEIIEGQWTLADIYGMLEEVDQMVAEVPHRVDIIADMTSAQFSSANLLSAINRTQRSPTSNAGMIVVVKANRYIKALADVAARVVPKSTEQMRFVETMDEAHALLAKLNPTKPDAP